MSILRARLRAWWPDVYMALFVAIPAGASIISPRAVLDPIGVGGLFPEWMTMTWAFLILMLCATLAGSVMARRYERAAVAALALTVLLGINGAVTIAVNGAGATWASGMYAVVGVAFFDRYRKLRSPVPLPPSLERRRRAGL